MSTNKAPVNDAIVVAVARLVDDAQSGTREPGHSDLEFQINRAGLSSGDPKGKGQVVGKAKRVRAVLSWGIDNAPDKAETFAFGLVSLVRGKGGFASDHRTSLAKRPSSTQEKPFASQDMCYLRMESFTQAHWTTCLAFR